MVSIQSPVLLSLVLIFKFDAGWEFSFFLFFLGGGLFLKLSEAEQNGQQSEWGLPNKSRLFEILAEGGIKEVKNVRGKK